MCHVCSLLRDFDAVSCAQAFPKVEAKQIKKVHASLQTIRYGMKRVYSVTNRSNQHTNDLCLHACISLFVLVNKFVRDKWFASQCWSFWRVVWLKFFSVYFNPLWQCVWMFCSVTANYLFGIAFERCFPLPHKLPKMPSHSLRERERSFQFAFASVNLNKFKLFVCQSDSF